MRKVVTKPCNLLSVTTRMTGKMIGMTAISSSMLNNPNCAILAKIKGTVCQKCYSKTALSYRQKANNCYTQNGEILSQSIIPKNQLPFINATFARLETHGDLINTTHLQNFINLCKKNPQCFFVLWSKQYQIILDYFKENKPPKNFRLVVSSLMLNKQINLKRFKELGLDCKVFTVYDKKCTKECNIKINCGGKNCIDCQLCYNKNSKTKEIKELLK